MKSIRTVLAGSLLAGGALLATAARFSIASAADDPAAVAAPPAPGADYHGHDRDHDRDHGRGPDHRGWGPGRLYSKLNLTAEQQASIKAIMTAAKPQMQSMQEQMKASHQKLMQTSPDDPKYGAVVAEAARANATMASQRTTQGAQLMAKMYAVLTPAQKTQLKTLEAQWAAEPHHDREEHRGPHAPGDAPTG